MTGWRMPAEFEPHERSWMAWPSALYTLGENAAEAEVARACWAGVANAIAEYEPLHMLVPPSESELIEAHMSSPKGGSLLKIAILR